jgi:large subunit ribosomal protein L29
MTKAVELRELPEAELRSRLESAKEELFNLRFQLATGQLDNAMRIKEVRREVARILTVLRQSELEEAPELVARTVGEPEEKEEEAS